MKTTGLFTLLARATMTLLLCIFTVTTALADYSGGDVTGISDATSMNDNVKKGNDSWYTLDGRKLDGKPSAKGMYIYQGNKVIIK